MNKTSIEWTDFTSNPLKFRDASGNVVWGCVHASPGCLHCYAETLAKRYGRGGPFNVPTMNGLTSFVDGAELKRLMFSKAIAGQRVFVGDMTDLFGEWVPDLLLAQIWEAFAYRQDVTFQVLTKRAERLSKHWYSDIRPLPNVWIGVSCEDQKRADERIPHLLNTPAAVRFISAEPLLGPIDLWRAGWFVDGPEGAPLDWVIVGGESGPGARSCELNWIRSIVDQCRAGGVPCFVKQLGSKPLERVIYGPSDFSGEQPVHLEPVSVGRKGSVPSLWPAELRVREFPREAVPA